MNKFCLEIKWRDFNHHSNRLLECLPIGKKHGVSFFLCKMSGKNTGGVLQIWRSMWGQIGFRTLRNLFLVSYLIALVGKSSLHKVDISFLHTGETDSWRDERMNPISSTSLMRTHEQSKKSEVSFQMRQVLVMKEWSVLPPCAPLQTLPFFLKDGELPWERAPAWSGECCLYPSVCSPRPYFILCCLQRRAELALLIKAPSQTQRREEQFQTTLQVTGNKT